MKTAQIKVELLDHMGSDLDVVNAARVSFNKEHDKFQDKDEKLIKYLAEHNHWSPFSHCFVKFRVKAPIFIARQLQKHTVGLSWNEVSRRYVDSEPEFYVPDMWRKSAENVKQGSSNDDFGKPIRTGKCLYCGGELPKGRHKYCCDNHQVYHSQQRLPYNTKFNRWKATAKASNIQWDLEIDDLDWPKYCSYLDLELNYLSDDKADNIASLDKIVPELGYVKGNVQIISLLANKMKSSATKEQILTFAKNSSLMHGGIFTDMSTSYEGFLQQCSDTYNRLIEDGLAPEQARMFMPQSMMTEFIWSGSLYAFARVCNLRLGEGAQKEAGEVAQQIKNHLCLLFPVSTKYLLEGT